LGANEGSLSTCGAQHSLTDAQLVGVIGAVISLCEVWGKNHVVEVGKSDATRAVASAGICAVARLAEGSRAASNVLKRSACASWKKSHRPFVMRVRQRPGFIPCTKPRVVNGTSGRGIIINDKEISRCGIELLGFKNERHRPFAILESTNGTFFEDERVRVAELKHLPNSASAGVR